MDNQEEDFISTNAMYNRFLDKYEDIKNSDLDCDFDRDLNAEVYFYLMYKKLKEFDSEKLAHKVSYSYFRDHQQIFFDEVYKDFFNLKNEVKAKINSLVDTFALKCTSFDKDLIEKNKAQVQCMIQTRHKDILEDKFAYRHNRIKNYVYL